LRDAVSMAQAVDPATFGFILAWTYGLEIAYGVILADDSALSASQGAVATAERIGNDNAVTLGEYGLALALLYRDSESERRRGLELMDDALVMLRVRVPSLVPVTELFAARERARTGDRDAAIAVMWESLETLRREGSFGWVIGGVAILVEALVERDADGDFTAAQEAVAGLESLCAEHHSAILDITILRVRAMLAGVRDEDGTYPKLAGEYLAMAESLGFEGHIRWAKAMT